jgi:hypothetical protein
MEHLWNDTNRKKKNSFIATLCLEANPGVRSEKLGSNCLCCADSIHCNALLHPGIQNVKRSNSHSLENIFQIVFADLTGFGIVLCSVEVAVLFCMSGGSDKIELIRTRCHTLEQTFDPSVNRTSRRHVRKDVTLKFAVFRVVATCILV